jgi:hypothetical protein
MKINYEKKFLKDIDGLDKEISVRLKSLIIDQQMISTRFDIFLINFLYLLDYLT